MSRFILLATFKVRANIASKKMQTKTYKHNGLIGLSESQHQFDTEVSVNLKI